MPIAGEDTAAVDGPSTSEPLSTVVLVGKHSPSGDFKHTGVCFPSPAGIAVHNIGDYFGTPNYKMTGRVFYPWHMVLRVEEGTPK